MDLRGRKGGKRYEKGEKEREKREEKAAKRLEFEPKVRICSVGMWIRAKDGSTSTL